MNGERGIDLNTDFQRSNVYTTITEEKTSLLKNNKTNEFVFVDYPLKKDGFSNYHLYLCYPERDNVLGQNNYSIQGYWSISSGNSPVIFRPEVHSSKFKRILASTQFLQGADSHWDNIDLTKFPDLKEFAGLEKQKNDVYEICNSLLEVYAKMQGDLSYVMVQPLYSSIDFEELGEITDVNYKTDINNFIAVFPAVAYNKASLNSQLY